MFETTTTNPATILMILAMWGTAIWAVTYLYLSEKIRHKDETIKFLDTYIEEDQTYIDMLRDHIDQTERDFGHVIDDYVEYYFTDGKWVKS